MWWTASEVKNDQSDDEWWIMIIPVPNAIKMSRTPEETLGFSLLVRISNFLCIDSEIRTWRVMICQLQLPCYLLSTASRILYQLFGRMLKHFASISLLLLLHTESWRFFWIENGHNYFRLGGKQAEATYFLYSCSEQEWKYKEQLKIIISCCSCCAVCWREYKQECKKSWLAQTEAGKWELEVT